MNTKTFTTNNGKYTFTTKLEFFEKCPNPENIEAYKLLMDYSLAEFLHNEKGPALVINKPRFEEYWLNGKQIKGDKK